MSATGAMLPRGSGLWAGFLDRLPVAEAVAAVRDLDDHGIATVWLQEYSGVDPFVRATTYLAATQRLSVALGLASIYARDAEVMVAAAATLHEAFPGRFHLGLGASQSVQFIPLPRATAVIARAKAGVAEVLSA